MLFVLSNLTYSPFAKPPQNLVSQVAKQINDAIHQRDNRLSVMRIQSMFVNDLELVTASRRFVRQGTLLKQCRSFDKKYEFFAFNDLILYADQTVTGKYKLHKMIDIDANFAVEDVPEQASTPDDKKYAFKLLNSKKSFIVYAPDFETKQGWMRDLQVSIDRLSGAIQREPKQNVVAPVWQSDHSAKNCQICQDPFTWTRRRHHCRLCGALVCNSCSLRKMIIRSSSDKNPQRICDNCVNAQLQAQAAKTAAQQQPISSASDESTNQFDGSTENSIVTQYQARYDYQAADDDELSFSAGDSITVLERDKSGWWLASIQGQTGYVPSNYLSQDDSGEPDTEDFEIVVVASAATPSKSEFGLALNAGDVINVSARDRNGHYYGYNQMSKQEGWFDTSAVVEQSDDGYASPSISAATPPIANSPPALPSSPLVSSAAPPRLPEASPAVSKPPTLPASQPQGPVPPALPPPLLPGRPVPSPSVSSPKCVYEGHMFKLGTCKKCFKPESEH